MPLSQYLPFGKPDFGPEEIQAVTRVMQSGWVGMGNETVTFEQELATFVQAETVVAVNSCTSALFLSLLIEGTGPFVFLMVARLLWDKGVSEYVNAARALKSEFPDVRCCLAGFLNVPSPSAVSRSDVEAWVAEGVIEYLGQSDDMVALYANADCVVLPSYREGMPKTLLEAAAMALPVVATDVPGCRQAVVDGETGILCRVRDAASLADAMRRMLLMTAEERRQIGNAGRERAVREFDEGIVVQRYMEVVKDILGDLHRGDKKG